MTLTTPAGSHGDDAQATRSIALQPWLLIPGLFETAAVVVSLPAAPRGMDKRPQVESSVIVDESEHTYWREVVTLMLFERRDRDNEIAKYDEQEEKPHAQKLVPHRRIRTNDFAHAWGRRSEKMWCPRGPSWRLTAT